MYTYVLDTLEIQPKVYTCYNVWNTVAMLFTLELVQTVTDWFNTNKTNHSLWYCKYLCSERVIRLLQPSHLDESNADC